MSSTSTCIYTSSLSTSKGEEKHFKVDCRPARIGLKGRMLFGSHGLGIIDIKHNKDMI